MSERLQPKLWTGPELAEGTSARCVALVLHGGKPDSYATSRPWHLSGVRMWQFTWAIRKAGRSEGVVAAQLQYRFRGWNGAERSPVADARWALQRLHRKYPGVPVVLVGHSMGGRAAAAVVDDPSVVGVVALAPWWPDGAELEAVRRDQTVHVLHGRSDTWTDAAKSRAETTAAAARGIAASFVSMVGGHFMIRGARLWVRSTTEAVMTIARDARPENICSEDNGVTS